MSDTILPHALPSALDAFAHVKVLSLDCFDTLLWRDTHAPRDVFGCFPGTTPLQRAWAETQARRVANIGRNRQEVSIGEIYAELLPNGSAAERDAGIAAEIAAEARHCFAFAPTVALMREAKARGIQVVIVSDTYLDPDQLRALIAASAGDEVARLIDRVFCSCTFGKSKAGGLYGDVLGKLKVRPEDILHIGDNRKADIDGVGAHGVHTLHLLQFSTAAEQRLRLEAGVGAMLHRQDGGEATSIQPHRAALAVSEPQLADAAEAFGLGVLGPVLHGFDRWLNAEAEALQARNGGTVHWLFLMRDGHLPKLVHEAGGRAGRAHAAEISRFTATATTFAQPGDVQRYLEQELGLNPATLARQLLIPEDDIARIVSGNSIQDDSMALLREVRSGQRTKAIARASREMAQRLVGYIRKTVNPAPGDTLMLVDLGYNGTVQNRIDALLGKELNVHIAGRYLLLREQDRPGLDKRGFLGLDHYDMHALEAMCANVAVLEQLCTASMGSVVDYTAEGEPVRRANDIKAHQSAVRGRVQAGALRFARECGGAVIRFDAGDEVAAWRKGAAAVLGRLMYMPLPEELAVLQSFEHDVNMGTARTVALFDPDVAARGLRQRGLFYMKGAERMYLPAELTGQGIAPKLTLLAHKRFGLPLNFADFADRTITLPVIYADRETMMQREVTATATHDGYFMAAIPIGDCRWSVAVQFGAAFEWVQVDQVSAMPVADFLSEEHRTGEEVAVPFMLDGMEEAAPGLLRSGDEAGFAMIHPPQRTSDAPLMLSVVFRPIRERVQAEAVQSAGSAAGLPIEAGAAAA